MDKVFLERMRRVLVKSKEDIIKSLISESQEFKAIVDDMSPKDLADVAAGDIDKKTLQVLNAREVQRLKLIDSALLRINNGRYGICLRCGKRIPHERLEAIPYAFMCVNCKSANEHKIK